MIYCLLRFQDCWGTNIPIKDNQLILPPRYSILPGYTKSNQETPVFFVNGFYKESNRFYGNVYQPKSKLVENGLMLNKLVIQTVGEFTEDLFYPKYFIIDKTHENWNWYNYIQKT